MPFGSKSTGPLRFKEDTGMASLKEESKSPKSPKSPGILGGLRKKPSIAKDHQFFSPIVSNRPIPTRSTNNTQASLANMLRSPVLDAYGTSPSKSSSSTNKLQMNKPFLQSNLLNTNLNHINMSSSHLLKKPSEGDGTSSGMSLRDMVKRAVGQKPIDNTKSTNLTSSFVGPKSPGLNSSQLSTSQLLNSPTTKQLYKEKAANRKSRFSEANPSSLLGKLNAFESTATSPAKQQPQMQPGMEEIPEVPKDEGSKLAKSRAKSLQALKLIQKVEDSPSNKEAKKFTSLAQTSYIWGGEKTPEKPPKPEKLKKKKSDELGGNLPIAGASSDPNHKWKRNLPFLESSQVTIDSFRFVRFLGRGAYGVVWLVEHKLTKDPYAMKIIDAADALAQNRMYALEAEQGIYEVLQGDFVVKAVYTFEHDSFICFVTEFMVGGDFNSILEEFGRLDIEQARFYFAELILAVESLHNENIVHRDLKPENILMDEKGHIRLTDFGLSNKQNIMRDSTGPSGIKSNHGSPLLGPETSNSKLDKLVKDPPVNKNMKVEFKVKQATKEGEFKVFNAKRGSMIRQTHREVVGPGAQDKKIRIIGTPDYIAPEILNPEKYPNNPNEKAIDWWSMGVILYEFMVGIPPFNADTREEIFDNIRSLQMEWPEIGDGEDCMTVETQDLIKSLLNPNPNTRLGTKGAQEIKKHKFFEGFDWDNLTVSIAPIIPECKLDMNDYGQFDGKNHPFSDSEGRKKVRLDSASKKKFFNMTRIELLQKMTLAKVQTPQKLKMTQSKKPF